LRCFIPTRHFLIAEVLYREPFTAADPFRLFLAWVAGLFFRHLAGYQEAKPLAELSRRIPCRPDNAALADGGAWQQAGLHCGTRGKG